MVACAAATGAPSVVADSIQLSLGFQPVALGSDCMQQNPSCAVVDQLKQQLRLVTENDDEIVAIDIISRLERLALTKEVLETTRIGATINEIRKQSAGKWPDVSKRCRALIKCWQKIAEFHRPISSCEGSSNSNGGTPNLVSPALKRGLTPRTPLAGKRVTSTDSNSRGGIPRLNVQDGAAQNGSYAPSQKGKSISPFFSNIAQSQHLINLGKSASVGGALCSLKTSQTSPASDLANSDEFSRDSLPSGADAALVHAQSLAAEKRKSTEEPPSVSAVLKRSKSSVLKAVSQQTSFSGSIAQHSATNLSVVAARKDVQSTAELVAQLSENLPQSMSIEIIKHESEFHRERSFPSTADYLVGSVSKSSPPTEFSSTATGKPKRKYTKRAAKFFRNSISDAQLSSLGVENIEYEDEDGSAAVSTHATNGYSHELDRIDEEGGPSTSTGKRSGSFGRGRQLGGARPVASFDWYSTIPTLDSLKNRTPEYAMPYRDQTSSFVIPIRERQVLLLPYVDIGMPDFVQHNFPEPEQYLAKQNFSPPTSHDFSSVQNKKNGT